MVEKCENFFHSYKFIGLTESFHPIRYSILVIFYRTCSTKISIQNLCLTLEIPGSIRLLEGPGGLIYGTTRVTS